MCIPVHEVLEYLAGGMSEEEILMHCPDLEREDIQACLGSAAGRERVPERLAGCYGTALFAANLPKKETPIDVTVSASCIKVRENGDRSAVTR